MDLTILCGILAGIIQLVGYWMYNRIALRDPRAKPNAASWGLWAFGSILTCSSYAEVVKDWVKEVLPFACVVACVFTFIFLAVKKKFSRPDKKDVLILVLDLAVLAFWIITDSARYANIALQVTAIISFFPIIREVWNDPRSENPSPWFVWSLAYALLFLTVILRYEKWWDLAYPVNYFLLHMIVGLIAKFRTA